MNLLEMKNIKKEFNGQSVLKDISLQVKEEMCIRDRYSPDSEKTSYCAEKCLGYG